MPTVGGVLPSSRFSRHLETLPNASSCDQAARPLRAESLKGSMSMSSLIKTSIRVVHMMNRVNSDANAAAVAGWAK